MYDSTILLVHDFTLNGEGLDHLCSKSEDVEVKEKMKVERKHHKESYWKNVENEIQIALFIELVRWLTTKLKS